ncbi:hypothetical protein [Streptomyces sp. NPDC004728]
MPEWKAYHRLATALQRKPEIARPLWRNATSDHGPGSTLSAEAFG